MGKADNSKFDIAIIGGGPAGYVAAIRAAQLGARTALVEARELGGTCLNRGCIPSKALLRCIEVLELAGSARRMGIKFADPEIDLDGVRRHASRAIKTLVAGVESLMDGNDITSRPRSLKLTTLSSAPDLSPLFHRFLVLTAAASLTATRRLPWTRCPRAWR